MNKKTTNNFWLRLDNAAKIYPAVQSKELTAVFRITVVLEEAVKIKLLFESLSVVEPNFPYFKVKLKAGFFWYYLEHYNEPVTVEFDNGIACRAFDKDDLLFRVLIKNSSISVEFSHVVTDGTGAFEFLKTLLFAYFEKCKVIIPANQQNELNAEDIDNEKFEDAFNRYYKNVKSPQKKLADAFHIPFKLNKTPRFELIKAVVPLDIISAKAKEYQVSLTEYLAAIYIYVLQDIYYQLPKSKKRKSDKIIRIQVPINLRKMFPSATMRNFSLFVMPGIDLQLGLYTFDEIVKTVHYQMRLETDPKLINKNISRNVGGEKNPIVRAMPLFFKSLILTRIYASNTKNYSGVVTNYGKVDFSPEINSRIKEFIFTPPPPNKILKINCGAIGFENKLVLSFGNITVSKEFERKFMLFLMSHGIHVKIMNG